MVPYNFEEVPRARYDTRAAPHAGARSSVAIAKTLSPGTGSSLSEKLNNPRPTTVHRKPVRIEGHDSRLRKVADMSNAKGAALKATDLGPNKKVKTSRDPPDHVVATTKTKGVPHPKETKITGDHFRGRRARTHGVSRPPDEFIRKLRKTLTARSLAKESTRTRWGHRSQERPLGL